MTAEYTTVVNVQATAQRVWGVLTDAAAYAEWNPEIVGLAGTLALNGKIKARVKIGGGAIRTVSMRVTAFDAPSRMQWTGGLPLGLFVGVRTFTVTPRPDGAEFRMHLKMSGPFASMILKSVGDRQPEIDTFAAALRARAERPQPS